MRGVHTCRGTLSGNRLDTAFRIRLSKGPMSRQAWRVTDFKVTLADPVVGDEDAGGKLATADLTNAGTTSGQVWDWDDSREIAWASCFSPNNPYRRNWSGPQLIDVDNIVHEDLFVFLGSDQGSSSRGVNYYIVLEPKTITMTQKLFAFIRNKGQDVP